MLTHLNLLFKQEEMADGLTTSKSSVISGWFTGGGTHHGWGFETSALSSVMLGEAQRFVALLEEIRHQG